jgi:signal transduction histidine kinase
MKILVVEDNEDSRNLLMKQLCAYGYEVTPTANGVEALEQALAQSPDIIVSDILMPVMDGFRLCRECKEDEKLKDIPFVFYTATYTDAKDEELALKVGADKFIRKPAEPEEFIKIIQGVIRDAGEGKISQKKTVVEEEKEVFKLYSERLVNKLEKKMLDLEAEIARRKRTEEELRKHRKHLEKLVKERTKELQDTQEHLVRSEKLAVLGQLAGGVGHELRNPLGAIKNAAYFLNMALEEPETEVKESLDILTKEVATSERIISSLIGFARPKSPTLRKVNVNEVVQEALSRNAVPENVEVVTQLNESLPTITADPEQLGQVFGNIMLNAIQAMPEGGQLLVKSEVPSSGWVAASFTDTGAGIPKENLGKLFEPLFTTKAKGIGLGLALTKTLVEGHGGTIEVESEEGKGSTFTVRLPVGTEEEK